ncbi:MAG: YdcF family protein [Roseobacter sp.]
MAMSVLAFITVPSNFLILLIVIGLCLFVLRWRRLGISAIGLGTAGFLTFGYTSAGELLMAPLVSRFPPVVLENAPEPFGIILVGSGINEVHANRTGALMELTEDGDGVPITALLARRFPQAHIIVSSGSGSSGTPAPLRPADGIRRILLELGIAEDRITIEPNSGSTFETARNAIALIGEDIDETWWVITSAHRMPRLIGAFRKLGGRPVPYPVDFRWIPPFSPFYTYQFTEGMGMTDTATKEWLGLMMYWYQNKTTNYFPAP